MPPAEPDPGAFSSQRVLRGARDSYRAVFDDSPVAMLLCEVGTLRVLAANQAAAKLHAATPEELRQSSLFELRRISELTSVMLRRASGQDVALGFGYHQRRDGSTFAAQLSVHPTELAGRPAWLCVLHSLEEQLRPREGAPQRQLFETVGRVAGGVAHDINNLLSVVLSFCNLVSAQLPQDGGAQADLAEIRGAAERATALTKQLLGLSRRGPSSPKPLQLNDLVRRLEKLLRRVLEDRLSLELALEPELDQVLADPVQVERLLLQLVGEARAGSTRPGARLTIETRHAELAGAPGGGRHVVLGVHVSDDLLTPEVVAIAAPPELGDAWLENDADGGARFVLCLPSVTGPRRSLLPSGAAGFARDEAVLVVQANPHLRKTLKTYFAREGFRVLDASGSVEALARAEHEPRLDLLLCDVALPDGTGPELSRALRARHPELKLLLALGHPEQRATLREDPLTAIISKPFDLQQFGALVQRLLAGSPR